ncbi:MAG: hypothetical protein KAI74_04040, partial [Kiritimatiellae bacterium]|nr:hypothetical protein [Kiritimatiellia bacterium]
SPMQYPYDSPDSPATLTINPATITIANVTNSPEPVTVNTPISITADITPHDGATNILPAVWYRVGGSGEFANITMINNGPATSFITSSDIPGQSIAGSFIQYYLVADFVGPASISPSNYPNTGYITIPIHTADSVSTHTSMQVTGDITKTLDLVSDNIWFGISSGNGSATDRSINFVGQNGGSVTWGDIAQPFTTMPVFATAEVTATSITMGGTHSGDYAFRFSETDNSYSAQLCDYVDFESFTAADASFSDYTNGDGWLISNAKITAVAESDRAFRGDSSILNNTGATSYAKSPNLANGIGEISFWYRNWWEDASTDSTTITIQKSVDGTSGWITIAVIEDVINLDYIHYSGFFYEPGYNYVRIVNGSADAHAKLLLDEVVVSEAGPGATFTTLQHSPTSPSVTNSVDVSVDIAAVHYATNMAATLWYRFGTNGVFDGIPMVSSAGNTYTNISSIPSGYNGTVEYYVEADFTGIVNSPLTYTASPAAGQYGTTNYSSSGDESFFVDFDDWSTTSYAPHTITNNGWVITDATIYTGVDTPQSSPNT